MKKILITGAGGYIGSNSVYLFLQKGYEIIGLDNFVHGYPAPLEFMQNKFGKEKLRFYKADLTGDISKVFKEENDIQAVIHYAAYCNVNESMKQPELYFKNNTYGTVNLLDTMTQHGINKLIFSSTCAVYGQSEYAPVDEKHPVNPVSPYGESKRMSEKIIEWYAQIKGLQYVILRYFNVCGASDDGEIGDSKNPSFSLMQNAVRAALDIAPFQLICPQVDTPDKTPIRDYINVVDLNEAHIQALEYVTKTGKSDIFNLGTGTGNSVLEIVNKVQELTGKKFDLGTGETRKGDPAKTFADNTKIKNTLGWSPSRTIEDSVKTLVEWYKKHPNGWST